MADCDDLYQYHGKPGSIRCIEGLAYLKKIFPAVRCRRFIIVHRVSRRRGRYGAGQGNLNLYVSSEMELGYSAGIRGIHMDTFFNQ